MDLKTIGLYALAGYGAYSLFTRFTSEEKTSSFRGTDWQQGNMQGTPWQKYNEFRGTNWQQGNMQGTDWQKYNEFTGTKWQQDTPVGTNWQRKGVFNNACGSCGA